MQRHCAFLTLILAVLYLGACALALYRGLSRQWQLIPFIASLGLFILSFAGLLISFYPYIVPSSVSIWSAAAPDNSLSFVLIGAAVLFPLILLYTGHAYWVFRGKVRATGGYR